MGFSFEKLEAYKKALDFAHNMYAITERFPRNEMFGLTSQLRRASVSIAANVAEGSGRYNKKDFVQYLRIARGSAYECVPLLEIASKREYLHKERYDKAISGCNELAKLINGLISSLK